MTKTYKLKSGKIFSITAKNKRKSKKWGLPHYAYTIVIDAGNLSYKTTFNDSYVASSNGSGISETLIDVAMDGILSDYVSYDNAQLLSDFMWEYGYDPYDKEGISAFYGCMETYNGLRRLFTEDEISELKKIFTDMN